MKSLTIAVVTASLTSVPAAADAAPPPGCREGSGSHLMVAAANPAAALAGCQVLLEGGSAVDAAVAVQAVLAVVEPQSSGLGGGSLITYYHNTADVLLPAEAKSDTASRKTRFFDGLAASGREVTAGLTVPTADEQARGVTAFDDGVDHSARAAEVPGTLAVLGQVHDRFGRLRWNRLFDDAITLAGKGFPVAPYLHDVLSDSGAVTPTCSYPDLRRLFCDGDEPKPVGATVHNPELAQTLREVRDGGAAAFYDPRGRIAPAIVARLHAGTFDPTADEQGPAVIPSLLTLRDFAEYRPVERQPLCTEVLEHELCTAAPPASGGLTLTTLLAIAASKDITGQEPNSAGYAHLAIEASRIAGTDSRAYVGDPGHDDVPLDRLTDPAYVASRAAEIKPDSALHPVLPGIPDNTGDNDSTSQISIVDAYGNALSMTTTVNLNFGSRVLARGIVLNNAATNFSAAGARVNAMEPHKRPRTSIAPSIVSDSRGDVELVVGAAGGGPIPDYVAQIVLGVIGYGEDPLTAISRPHVSGQARTTNCAGIPDVYSDVEAGTPAAQLLPALRELHHPCARATTLRSGPAAVQVTGTGLVGAADPRRDGAAFGR